MSQLPDTVTAADASLVAGVPADERRPRDWLSPVRDTLAITWRNLIGIRRVPQLMVFTLIQPVIFVLLFTYVFGGACKGWPPGVPSLASLVPVVFFQPSAFCLIL